MRAGFELGVLCVPNACFAIALARQRGPDCSDYASSPLREVEFRQTLAWCSPF